MIGFTHSLQILVPTLGAEDGFGVKTRTFANEGDPVGGFLYQKNATVFVNGSLQTIEQWEAKIDAGPTVELTYQVQDVGTGIKYHVESVAPLPGPPTLDQGIIVIKLTKAGA